MFKRLIIIYFWIATLFCQNLIAQSSNDNLLLNLKTNHPRLLVKDLTDFSNLEKTIAQDSFLSVSFRNLKSNADKILVQPSSKYSVVPSNYLLNTARTVLDRSYTLAMMYRLTKEKKYSDRLFIELNKAAKYPDWDSQHFLGTAEMTHAFAIAYDWLYDVWSPDERSIIKTAIIEKGLKQGLLYYQGKGKGTNWTLASNNWNQVCNGGLLVGALAIAEDQPALSNTILKNALTGFRAGMKLYGPDGGWLEGPTYLVFALKYNVLAIASLQSSLNSDFGLSGISGFEKTGDFLIGISGSKGQTFNYGDAPSRVITMPEFFWLSKKFNIPNLALYQKKFSDNSSAIEMLWYNNKLIQGARNESLNRYFRNVEVVSLRTSFTDTNAWFVAFKAGRNGVPHGHLDLGTFVLEKFGQRWVVDLGPDSYNLPGYFRGGGKRIDQRNSIYRVSTEGHNVIYFARGASTNQNADAKSLITKVNLLDKPFGIMDLTKAYSPDLNSIKRGIRIINSKEVLVQDEIKSSKPIDLYWQIHTPAIVKISDSKRTAILTLGNERLKVEILSPVGATFEILTTKQAIASGRAKVNKENRNAGIRRLMVHSPEFKSGTIAVVFKEVDDNELVKILKLEEW